MNVIHRLVELSEQIPDVHPFQSMITRTHSRAAHPLVWQQVEAKHKSSHASFAVTDSEATLLHIRSGIQRQGHASELIDAAKSFYQRQGKKFAMTDAISESGRRLIARLS